MCRIKLTRLLKKMIKTALPALSSYHLYHCLYSPQCHYCVEGDASCLGEKAGLHQLNTGPQSDKQPFVHTLASTDNFVLPIVLMCMCLDSRRTLILTLPGVPGENPCSHYEHAQLHTVRPG